MPHIKEPRSPWNTTHPKFGEQQSSTERRPHATQHDVPIPTFRPHRPNSVQVGLQAVRDCRDQNTERHPRRSLALVDNPSTSPAFRLPRPPRECWGSFRKKMQIGSALHADSRLATLHITHRPKLPHLPYSALPQSSPSLVMRTGHTPVLSTPTFRVHHVGNVTVPMP